MYSGENIKRERNPKEKANLFSILSFFYIFKIVRKGVRRDLNNGDIYEIMKGFESEKLGNKLEKLWEKEVKKSKPILLRPVIKIFGLEYTILGIVSTVAETCSLTIIVPLCTGKVVSYFDPASKLSKEDALMYATGLIVSFTIYNIINNNYFFKQQQLCMKTRIACCSLLYQKCLKLNLISSPQYVCGKALTLMTKDVMKIDVAADYMHMMWTGAAQLIASTFIIYNAIGVSAFFGLSILFLKIPVDLYLGKKTANHRLKTAEKTDQRVRVTQEVLTAIRTIKMYTWELFFNRSVSALRKKEIRELRILFYIKAIALAIGQLSSRVAFYVCVMAYVALGNHITAEKAFVVTECFGALHNVLTNIMPMGIAQFAELHTCVQRITSFLLLEEVPENQDKGNIEEKLPKVCIKNCIVKLDSGVGILYDVSLEIKEGITVLTGPTGAGKSTLLKLVLRDIPTEEGSVEVSGRFSYASQEPWLFPATVKQNIIFGEPLDEKRYETVVKVCALKKDFESFAYGDKTCLTDRGLNLSRGQKTRINLARAVYKKADIYLLDDCLSAVDMHVGKHIFYECIKGFLKGKICVLVTHQNQVLKEVDNIVVMNEGGITFQGNYKSLKEWDNEEFKSTLKEENDSEFSQYNEPEKEKVPNNLDAADEETNLLATAAKYKNIYEETKQEGAVSKTVYLTYLRSGGGIKMLVFILILFIIAQVTTSWSDYFVSFWVDTEQEMSGFRYNHTTHTPEYKKLQESHDSIMKQYSFVMLAAAIFTLVKTFTFFIFSSKASTSIHNSVLDKILNAGMPFFDANLSGNVLNRLSRDLSIIDEQLPFSVFECINLILSLAGVLTVVSSVNLFFIIPSIILSTVIILARQLYIPSGRSIRRLEGATRSPLIGHLNATLDGLPTIRASQAQGILRREFDKHQDLYNSTQFMNLATTRAFGFYIDLVCSIYTAVITFTFLFFKTETLAGRVGLAITQSYSLTGTLQWGVRQWAELENQMTSTERVLEYKRISPEEKSGDKLDKWPNNGKIVFNGVNLKYSSDNETILKDVSFIIEPKQKIGIVGRTGAGKSSIISTLFRMYDFKGSVTIDDVNINTIAVELLRSKVSIIPQDPVLFSGTVRSNLDPYEQYDDKILWDALEEVEMKNQVGALNEIISEGGNSFSIGQRQLLCLARAIVRNNSILVLDEATANVDPQTDALIQRTIKRRFSDCTIIMIAHRLYTIMDSDMVLVMDFGNVVEYNHPKILLENKNGTFYSMAKEAGLL